MENLSMCRMCLATDVRLCSLTDNLQHMYEKITAMSFQREDKRPLVACYICHARLRNCYQLCVSCLRSEELLTEMQSSGVLKPQEVSSTNTFRVESVLNLSIEPMLQKSTECHLKEEAAEVIDDIKLEPQEEHGARLDNNIHCSYLEDHLDVMKMELDDVETDTEGIQLEIEEIIKEDNNEDSAGPSSQSVDNIRPKIVKVVSGTTVQNNDAISGTPVHKKLETVNKNIVIDKLVAKMNTNGTVDKVGGTSHKPRDNEVTADDDVRKQTSNSNNSLDFRSDEKRFHCNVCSKCFKRKYHLTRHIRTHTGVKPYMCNVCQKCFAQKSKLTCHVRTHTSEKPYICDVCNKGFTKKEGLVEHKRIHIGDKPYMCDFCNKCFTRKGTLTEHTRIHTGDKPYTCDVCKKCFSRISTLKEHSRTHTGDKPYMCDVCKKCFTKKDTLIEHTRTHSSIKSYICDTCKKCFTRKDTLIDHIRSHTGDKPYTCGMCKKRLRTSFALRNHIRTHTGDKPYKCNVCKKSFRTSNDLKGHIRTHTGKRTYTCNLCKKSFPTSNGLKRHIRTHTGEKPYVCNICQKCFSLKGNLELHTKRQHTLEKLYNCDLCNKKYSDRSLLKSHIVRAHW